MRGVPLTPAQIARAAEVYGATGSYQAAADAIGSDRSNVRRRLLARGEPHRAALHAQACARGLRKGRRSLVAGLDELDEWLAKDKASGGGIEPRDYAALLNARARHVEALLALAEREDRRKQARLTRAKTRAETAALQAKAAGLLPPDVTVTVTDPDAVAAIFRQHFGDEGHRPRLPAPAHDTRAEDGAHDVGEPVLPVPADVGR